MDCECQINLVDAVYLIDYLFRSGGPPAGWVRFASLIQKSGKILKKVHFPLDKRTAFYLITAGEASNGLVYPTQGPGLCGGGVGV